jgi:hypothetical protein
MEELEILGLDVLIEPIDGPRRRSNVKHDHSLLALLRSEYGDPNVVVVLEVHLYTITDGDARRIAIDYPASDADTLFSVQLDYGQDIRDGEIRRPRLPIDRACNDNSAARCRSRRNRTPKAYRAQRLRRMDRVIATVTMGDHEVPIAPAGPKRQVIRRQFRKYRHG